MVVALGVEGCGLLGDGMQPAGNCTTTHASLADCLQWGLSALCVLCVCVPVPQVGPTEHAICALSGGVDSTVAATLVHRVLGDRLHCVFVDHGLLRYKVGGGCWGRWGGRVVLCGGRTRRGEREGSWGNDGGGGEGAWHVVWGSMG